jgi:uncharacterized PurR-regulated membrane protein YhhQ (DUF165 family)
LLIPALIYITAVLAANYTATWFLPLPIFGQVAVGTFIFGITFTQRDLLHQFGRRRVYQVLFLTAVLSVIESLVLGVPYRIIIASFTAILLSETADTEVYQRLLNRSWMLKVASSNAVSIPIDTLIFNLIAFLGVFPPLQLLAIMWGEIVVKTLMGVLVGLITARQRQNPQQGLR